MGNVVRRDIDGVVFVDEDKEEELFDELADVMRRYCDESQEGVENGFYFEYE